MWFIQYTIPPGSQVWITCEPSKDILKEFKDRQDEKDVKNIAELVLRRLNITYGGVRVCFLETHVVKPS